MQCILPSPAKVWTRVQAEAVIHTLSIQKLGRSHQKKQHLISSCEDGNEGIEIFYSLLPGSKATTANVE